MVWLRQVGQGWLRSSAVEQGNHNPLVGGSNPSAATISRPASQNAANAYILSRIALHGKALNGPARGGFT